MPSDRKGACCVDDCEAALAPHTRVWTLSAEGWGEIEIVGAFCCEHLDAMEGRGEPLVDLRIAGAVRG